MSKIGEIIDIGEFQKRKEFFGELLERAGFPRNDITDYQIRGPFDGKINSMYCLEFPIEPPVLLRFRVSRAFRYEAMVKEKILYPFLDGGLNPKEPGLRDKIGKIARRLRGQHVFTTENPSRVPVQDLIYWDETKELIPYDYTIKQFIPGSSLYDLLDRGGLQAITPETLEKLFEDLGKMLGQLHDIEFDGFYERITEIGDPKKRVTWPVLFQKMYEKEMTEAQGNKSIQPLLTPIKRFFRDAKDIILEDQVPIVFHNDFQAQNVIIKPLEITNGVPEIGALIDFDNWRVGIKPQDFVKITFWTIKGNASLLEAFTSGYRKYHGVDNNFLKQVEVLKLLWFILVYNFEEDKIRKAEQNAVVDRRFPASDQYLREIETLVREYL